MKYTIKYACVAAALITQPAFADTQNGSIDLKLDGWFGYDYVKDTTDTDSDFYGEITAMATIQNGAFRFGLGGIMEIDYDLGAGGDISNDFNPQAYVQYKNTRLTYGTIEDAEDHLFGTVYGTLREESLADDREMDFEEYTFRLDTEFQLSEKVGLE